MTIKNFILIRYKRRGWDNMPQYIHEKYAKMNMDEWDEVQENLLKQQIQQIKNFYPKCNIHLITNDKSRIDSSLIIHYFPEMQSNHVSKLKIYGLINEPAMYLDNDIIINKRWNEEQLFTKNEMNLYGISKSYDVQSLACDKLPAQMNQHYQGGVIWIKSPSKKLSDELFEIHEKYFSDKQKIKNQGRWADSDELPISLYAKKNKIEMKLDSTISVNRVTLNKSELKNYQSIHYTGIDIEVKKLCLKEYKEINTKIYL